MRIYRCEADDEVLYVEAKEPEDVPAIITRYFGDGDFKVGDVRVVSDAKFIPEGKEIVR